MGKYGTGGKSEKDETMNNQCENPLRCTFCERIAIAFAVEGTRATLLCKSHEMIYIIEYPLTGIGDVREVQQWDTERIYLKHRPSDKDRSYLLTLSRHGGKRERRKGAKNDSDTTR